VQMHCWQRPLMVAACLMLKLQELPARLQLPLILAVRLKHQKQPAQFQSSTSHQDLLAGSHSHQVTSLALLCQATCHLDHCQLAWNGIA